MEPHNKKEPITDKHYDTDVNYSEWKQSLQKEKEEISTFHMIH